MCVCETIENSQNWAKSAQKGAWFRSHFSKIATFSDFSLKSMYLCMNVCMYVCCMNVCVYVWVYVCMCEDLRGNPAKISQKIGENSKKSWKNPDFWGFCGISSWCMCMYVCMYVCMGVVCMHVCMYVHMYVWNGWKFWLKMLKYAKNLEKFGFYADFCGFSDKMYGCMYVCMWNNWKFPKLGQIGTKGGVV